MMQQVLIDWGKKLSENVEKRVGQNLIEKCVMHVYAIISEATWVKIGLERAIWKDEIE